MPHVAESLLGRLSYPDILNLKTVFPGVFGNCKPGMEKMKRTEHNLRSSTIAGMAGVDELVAIDASLHWEGKTIEEVCDSLIYSLRSFIS